MLFLEENDPRRKVWERSESPIEQMMCCALFSNIGLCAVPWEFDRARLPELAELAGATPSCFLFAQHHVEEYRSDFLLVAVNPSRRMAKLLVLECDGKKYHTGENNINRDKARDAIFAERGYRVVRYSGSAIYSSMVHVLAEIREWLSCAGVSCKPHEDFGVLAHFFGLSEKSDREIREERKKERDAHNHAERNHRDCFIGDDGNSFRWSDTL